MQPITHLFTVRVWQEEVGDGSFEWRGSIRSGVDGEIQYFVGLSPTLSRSASDPLPDSAQMRATGRTLGDVAQQMVEQLDDPVTWAERKR